MKHCVNQPPDQETILSVLQNPHEARTILTSVTALELCLF